MFALCSPSIVRSSLPWLITIVLLPYSMAFEMLCVIIRVVSAFSFTIFSVILMTFSAVLGSSAAVCSSRSRSFGVTIVAISNVSACRCPPESKPTGIFILSSRPRSSSLSLSLNTETSFFLIPIVSERRFPRL